MRRKSHTRELFCLALVKETDQSSLWNGMVRGQNLRTQGLAIASPSFRSNFPSEHKAILSVQEEGRAYTIGPCWHFMCLCKLGKMTLLPEQLETNVSSRWTNQNKVSHACFSSTYTKNWNNTEKIRKRCPFFQSAVWAAPDDCPSLCTGHDLPKYAQGM